MTWLYLLLAIAALAVAFKTASVALMVVMLLVGFALLMAWLMGFLAARLESRSGDVSTILDPAELSRLRAQAEATRAAAEEPPIG